MNKFIFFPAYPIKLFFKNKNGKTNIIHFSNRAKILCFKNGSIGIRAKDIGIKLFNVDKLQKIEYKRNEKSWKKYHGKMFLHNFDGNEQVIGYNENPNFIKIKSNHKLWGYQKILDEEVE